jgi:aminoglycoside phosphotransferase (APT) family kinase protein
MPAAEVDVSPDLVRRLLADQQPDLAGLPVTVLANGWDNLICRLGDGLLVRLPRRAMAATLIEHEQRWLPILAPRLPLPVPAPVRVGRPALGYPWSWSVVPYLPGRMAATSPPADLAAAAVSLGGFLAALHVPAAPDAPANPFRGGPLAARRDTDLANLDALGGSVDRRAVLALREAAAAAPVWDRPPVWLHGDLHPMNILVDRGSISAVIDFGDITAGDPATDLYAAWMLLDEGSRGLFQDTYRASARYPVGPDTWARARGWALSLSVVFLAHSADNPLLAAVGQAGLSAALGG